ncbi:hypothetical protein PRUPE_1G183600 [Prunus persica]|uniref:Uncharacterized protein n=1 Tax=Prunus persica TaxID=3760 RepID=A0A251QZB9_PRUPE|nr:hypothetical protein PRUPE_1G183600 [Prunus persica]
MWVLPNSKIPTLSDFFPVILFPTMLKSLPLRPMSFFLPLSFLGCRVLVLTDGDFELLLFCWSVLALEESSEPCF